jgi:hypothetical protein
MMDEHLGFAGNPPSGPPDANRVFGCRGPATRQEPLIKIHRRIADRTAELAVTRALALHARLGKEAWADSEPLSRGYVSRRVSGADFSAIGVLLP